MAKLEERARTRGQNVYAAILTAIRDGVYSPGEALREEEVAARFGVSRTPVREALGRLQEKGLLEAAQGRGVAVAILSMEQIFELYAIRQSMEGLVARFAAQHATPAEIDNLARINAHLEHCSSPQRAAEINRNFHARLYDAARNRYLRQMVEGLQETIALLPVTTFVQVGRAAIAYQEHGAIIAAVRSRDLAAAEDAAVQHIARSLEARLAIGEDPKSE